jgi:toxin-antitoxin system PIN domain toxin
MAPTMSPDLGVLLAASRADHPQHGPAIAWLRQAIAACATGGSIEILPMVAAGFLRLASSRRIFIAPTPISAAIAFIDSLLVIPGIEMAEPEREWPTFRQLSGDHELAGNDIMAAWTAAAIRAVGSHLVTFDRGFTRLLGRTEVTVLDPA